MSVVSSAKTEKHLDALIFSTIFFNNISPHIDIISFCILGLKYLLRESDSRNDLIQSSSFTLYFKISRKLPSFLVNAIIIYIKKIKIN